MQVQSFLDRLKNVTPKGKGWLALCPAHNDHDPSLSISEGKDGRILLKCFVGCETEAIVKRLGLEMKDLFPDNAHVPPMLPSVSSENMQTSLDKGLTLEEFAENKHLPVEYLRLWGWENYRRKGKPAIRIPYLDVCSRVCTIRYRMAMQGRHRFEYRSGDHAMLYGLERLSDIHKAGWVLLVEGESDVVTAWFHGIPALGVPGKDQWKPEWAKYLNGLEVFVWQEPNAESFADKIGRDIP